jgi:tRNA methyltransferase complex GCD14 subunit N-term
MSSSMDVVPMAAPSSFIAESTTGTTLTFNRRAIAQAGDMAIFYQNGELTAHVLVAGGTYDTKFGRFSHDDVIGKPYGSKVS